MKDKELLPETHVVDAGYPSAELLVSSMKNYEVDLFGPVRPDVRWQSQDEEAFDITQFRIDWANQNVICPMGKTSSSWTTDQKGPRGKATIQVAFRKMDCNVCTARKRCTRSKTAGRSLTLQPKELQEALQSARRRQKTKEFQTIYSIRSGIEGTIGEAADKHAMRRCRYRGQAKAHLQHLVTAAAINILRMLNWIENIPRSITPKSHFVSLAVLS